MLRRSGLNLLCAVFILHASLAAFGADWPMWRHDTMRTGATAAKLPARLSLKWIRRNPPARSAWPNDERLGFDANYQPVVSGSMLFFGSPNDDSVTAINTGTGAMQWRFVSEGPVRFAPVIWKGKVYFGSDDGFLYCLSAKDGRELWKFRAGPVDKKHLGNERLVSVWPVRGGPVIADGVVYCTAGLWPNMGIFIHALNAVSGKVIWTNSDGGYLENIRLDHNLKRDAGLSPQGYLAVRDNVLLIPNGRSLPAAFDRKTGKLLWYRQGYRHGGSNVVTDGKYIFVGKSGVLHFKTGLEVGSRWDPAKPNWPRPWATRDYTFIESSYFSYKFFPGCDANAVLDSGISYGSEKGVLYAYDLTKPKLTEYKGKGFNHSHNPWRWDIPLLWKHDIKSANAKKSGRVVIKAGNRIYASAGSTVFAVETSGKEKTPKRVWSAKVEGTPGSMLAANGKLFVITRDGDFYCFGRNTSQPRTRKQKITPLKRQNDKWTQMAESLAKMDGASEGYCLMLGLGEGRLLKELLARTKLHIIAVDPDGVKVDGLRKELLEAGLYGKKAVIHRGDPLSFDFPPFIANLIVAEKPKSAGVDSGKKFVKTFYRSLRPYGGLMCLSAMADKKTEAAGWVAESALANAEISRAGEWLVVKRAGPLPGSAPWTHEAGSPARTYYSSDSSIKLPLGILWYGDSDNYAVNVPRAYNGNTKPQAVNGRLITLKRFSDNPSRQHFGNMNQRMLHVYDVYTGRQFWRKEVPADSKSVSLPEGIYVAAQDNLTLFDQATGRPLKVFPFLGKDKKGKTFARLRVIDLRIWKDVAVIAYTYPGNTGVVGVNRNDWKILWRHKIELRLKKRSISVGGGRVFLADHVSHGLADRTYRRGGGAKIVPTTITALDIYKGTAIWTQKQAFNEKSFVGRWAKKTLRDKYLEWAKKPEWLAYSETCDVLISGRNFDMYGRDAKTGKLLWHYDKVNGWLSRIPENIIRGDKMMMQDGNIYDIRTGKRLKQSFKLRTQPCHYAVMCENLLTIRDQYAMFVDWKTKEKFYVRNLRTGCGNGFFVAEGVVNVPGFSAGCICNYPLQTAFAMVYMEDVESWPGSVTAVKKRTKKGN